MASMSNRVATAATLLTCIALFCACGGSGAGGDVNGPGPTVASVVLTPGGPLSLAKGSSAHLSAAAYDASHDALTGKTFTYTSSDTTRAKVDASGLVTAIGAPGDVNITGETDGVVSAPVVVHVTAAPVASVVLTPAGPVNLAVGSALQLNAAALDATGAPIDGQTLTFATSDPSRLSVSPTGLVSAIGLVGPVTVTASAGSVTSAPVTVQVTVGPAATVSKFSAEPTNVVAGSSVSDSIRVVVRDAGGNPVPGATVAFAVAGGGGAISPASGTTDASGHAAARFVTGTKVGTNTATATVGGLAPATFNVATIAGAPVSAAVVTNDSVAGLFVVDSAAKAQMSVVGNDANGNPVPLSTFSLTSRDPSVATVSSAGVVTGVSKGQTVIVASSGAMTDSIVVLVASPTGLVLVHDMMLVGDTITDSVKIDMRRSTEKLGAVSITLQWDPAVLTYKAVEFPQFSAIAAKTSGTSTGSLTAAGVDPTGFTGQVPVITVHFTVTPGQKGTFRATINEVTGAASFTNLTARVQSAAQPIITP